MVSIVDGLTRHQIFLLPHFENWCTRMLNLISVIVNKVIQISVIIHDT